MTKSSKLKSQPSRKPSAIGRTLLFLLILVLVAAGGIAGIVLFETEKPLVTIETDNTHIGRTSEILVEVRDRRSGLRSIQISIEQDGKTRDIFSEKYERRQWFYGAGPEKVETKAIIDVDKAKLKDGEAELIVTVNDFSLNNMFLGNETVKRMPVTIDTKPPRIALQHSQRYIRPGGAGMVVYDLSEPAEKHGVLVNGLFFQGFPMRDRENRYVAFIGLPWDTESLHGSTVVALDAAGNEGKAIFSMVLKNVPEKTDRINVSDGFLNNKIPEFEQYYPEMTGSMLEQYLYANNDIRRRNAETIREVCSKPLPDRLWKDRFLRMSGQTMAGFAEKRTYYYQGEPVDNQVHLGIDIASVANADIKAANRGKVVFADYLGIYGYTVILDHGQGIFSLYSHLSRIGVAAGEIVDQGATIASSGATGMAGGDHLHFSMLVNGIFVTPVEWWDQQWIDLNIQDVLSQL